jgi:hypothetical protein
MIKSIHKNASIYNTQGRVLQESPGREEPILPTLISNGESIGGRPIGDLISESGFNPFAPTQGVGDDRNGTLVDANVTRAIFDPANYTNADVLIYGCTPSGLYTALRLLEPEVTQDALRDDMLAGTANGITPQVVILEPSGRCGGRLLTANPPEMESFNAELGDMGYYSQPSSYVDILVKYLGMEVSEVMDQLEPSNLLYLRGRHFRADTAKDVSSELYRMSYVEQQVGGDAADLLMIGVEQLVPNAFELNETEWQMLFATNYEFTPGVPLHTMGFWNALGRVMSQEALQYVKAVYGKDSMFFNNVNAIEGVVSVVLAATSQLTSPTEGMEQFVVELQRRVLALGGLIAYDVTVVDLMATNMNGTNVTDTEPSTFEPEIVTAPAEINPPEVDADVGNTRVRAIRRHRHLQRDLQKNTIVTIDGDIPTYDLLVLANGGEILEVNGIGNIIFATPLETLSRVNSAGLDGAGVSLVKQSEFFLELDADIGIDVILASRQAVEYARLYLCYENAWWTNIGIEQGRSMTDSPLRQVMYYTDYACLSSNSNGPYVEFWKALLGEGMDAPPYFALETVDMPFAFPPADSDEKVATWSGLNAPAHMVEEAQRLLKEMHNLPFIPSPTSAIVVTSDMIGHTTSKWKPGINPYEVSQALTRPRADWNVFVVGEPVAFPYLSLEADFRSAEDMLQMYFFAQPEAFTFDQTGELRREGHSQMGSALSMSTDGTRLALVSTMEIEGGRPGVTVYQRIGDEFLGMWDVIGENFLPESVQVPFSTTAASSNETDLADEGGRRYNRRRLVERFAVSITSVALSGDGNTLAISYLEEDTGFGFVQVYKDNAPDDGAKGNWTHWGMGLVYDDENNNNVEDIRDTEFGYALSLSFDGHHLAVGAPSADIYGVVVVFDCSSECTQMGQSMQGTEGAARYGSSVSLSYDGQVVAAGAPNVAGTQLPGSAFVFGYQARMEGVDWYQVGSMSERVDDDQFGFSISMAADASAVAVGAPGTDGGSAYVYRFSSTTLDGPMFGKAGNVTGPAEGDNVGFSVALSGNSRRLLVGALQIDSNSSGYVLALEAEGEGEQLLNGLWTEFGSPLQGDVFGDFMGYAVALDYDGLNLAVSAPQAGTEGAVKTFEYVVPTFVFLVPVESADATLLARMLWAEATNGTVPWPEDLECIPRPAKAQVRAARANGILAVLGDERLTTEIEEAMLFNLYDGVIFLDPVNNCTTLLEFVGFLQENSVLPQSFLENLDMAQSLYIERVTSTPPAPTQIPVSVPTTPPLVVVTTLSPTFAPVTELNVTDTNSTDTELGTNTTDTVPDIDTRVLDAVQMRVVYNGLGWIGIGVSDAGEMIGSNAIVGEPDLNTVTKYDMVAKDVEQITGADAPAATLSETNIQQDVDAGTTTMEFVKLLDESDISPTQIPLAPSGNSQFIYAYSVSNTFNYHGDTRGEFLLDLGKCDDPLTSMCVSDDPDYDSQEVIVTNLASGAPIYTVYWKKVNSEEVRMRRQRERRQVEQAAAVNDEPRSNTRRVRL